MPVYLSNAFSDSNLGAAALTIASARLVAQAFPDAGAALLPVDRVGGRAAEKFRHTLAACPHLDVIEPLIPPKGGPLGGARQVGAAWRVLRTQPSGHPAVEALRGARAVVGKAGHIYFPKDGGSARGLASLWMTTYPLRLAAALGVPTAALNTSVGPFPSRAWRAVAGSVLRRLDLVVPREPGAFDEALRLGVAPERLAEVPDIVFSFERPTEDAARAAAGAAGLPHGRFGVLTLSEIGGMDDSFLDALAGTLRTLLDRGVVDRVTVPLHYTRDRAVSERFLRRAADPRIAFLPMDAFGPEALMALYRSARFLVARRMHSAIFALVAGTPAYPFTMAEQKVERVFGSLGLGDFVQASPLRDPKALADRIAAEVDDPAVEARIVETVDRTRAAVLRLPDLLAERLARP